MGTGSKAFADGLSYLFLFVGNPSDSIASTPGTLAWVSPARWNGLGAHRHQFSTQRATTPTAQRIPGNVLQNAGNAVSHRSLAEMEVALGRIPAFC